MQTIVSEGQQALEKGVLGESGPARELVLAWQHLAVEAAPEQL